MFPSLDGPSGRFGSIAIGLSYLLHWIALGLLLIQPPSVKTVPSHFPAGFFARRAPDPSPPPPETGPDGPRIVQPMRITQDMQQPVLIHKVEPDISGLTELRIRAGVLILEAVIDTDGTVRQMQVLRSLHPILDRKSIEAV
jgi:hypothetical protein